MPSGRFKRIAGLIVVCACAAVGRAQDGAPDSPDITEAECRAWLERLADPSMRGRGTGTDEGRRAGNWIAAEFERLGLYGAGTDRTYFQEFPVTGGRTGRNVLGLLLGTDDTVAREVILVSAHYDHLRPGEGPYGPNAIYPGADDNASGVAALLELAEHFADRPPRRSILFAAWDAEENQVPGAPSGLQGSGAWVTHPTVALDKIATMICMDMLSRDFLSVMDDTLYVVGAERSDDLRALVAAADEGSPLTLDLAGADIVGPRSDHWHFFGRQIPFLFFSTSQHRAYHTPQDTVANADIGKLTACTRAIAAVIAGIGAAPHRPHFRKEAYVGPEEIRAFLRVAERVLQQQERFVWQPGAQDRLRGILERGRALLAAGTVTAADRRALALAAGALLLYQVRER